MTINTVSIDLTSEATIDYDVLLDAAYLGAVLDTLEMLDSWENQLAAPCTASVYPHFPFVTKAMRYKSLKYGGSRLGRDAWDDCASDTLYRMACQFEKTMPTIYKRALLRRASLREQRFSLLDDIAMKAAHASLETQRREYNRKMQREYSSLDADYDVLAVIPSSSNVEKSVAIEIVLQEAIAAQSKEDAQMLKLYLEGYQQKEIARAVQLSEGTVSKHLSRILPPIAADLKDLLN